MVIALKLLQKEFPQLETFELPSYNITYSKKANSFKLKLHQRFSTVYSRPSKTREKLVTDSLVQGLKILIRNYFGQ
jgi:hypothetical protein